MLSYAQSIDFLNTQSSEVYRRPPMDDARRKEIFAELLDELIMKYKSLPREIKFGAIYYQAAARSGLAAPYLLLHHQVSRKPRNPNLVNDTDSDSFPSTTYRSLSSHKNTWLEKNQPRHRSKVQ